MKRVKAMKNVQCVCDLRDVMRNGCPSARGLPCRSANRCHLPPIDDGEKLDTELIQEKAPEQQDKAGSLTLNESSESAACASESGAFIEHDDVAMAAISRLVDKGYTEYEILSAYRRIDDLKGRR
jgi:hypothetical protein